MYRRGNTNHSDWSFTTCFNELLVEKKIKNNPIRQCISVGTDSTHCVQKLREVREQKNHAQSQSLRWKKTSMESKEKLFHFSYSDQYRRNRKHSSLKKINNCNKCFERRNRRSTGDQYCFCHCVCIAVCVPRQMHE